MRAIRNFCLVSLLGLVLLASPVWTLAPQAQLDSAGWSAPVDLSADVRAASWTPQITADRQGGVHVVFKSWVSTTFPQNREDGNTIFYRSLKDNQWSQPVDILSSPERLMLTDIEVTPNGTLGVLWYAELKLMLSQAPVEQANDPKAWQTSVITTEGGIQLPKLAYDEKAGIWYTSYALPDRVYFSQSRDGVLWSEPRLLWVSESSDQAPLNGGLTVGADGSVHLVWSEHSAKRNWAGVAIWYARVKPYSGAPIATREVIRFENKDDPSVAYPSVAATSNGTILLFWNNGVGSKVGRYYQVSPDNGESWRPVLNVFSKELSGQTGTPTMVVDSLDQIHLVTAAQGPNDGTGMRYASWANGSWSAYQSLWVKEFPGEWPAAAISNGNRLHVVWYEYQGNIVYTSLQLNVPVLPAQPFLTATPSPSPLPPRATATVTPTIAVKLSQFPAPVTAEGSLYPLLVGTGSTILLLVAVIIWRSRKAQP